MTEGNDTDRHPLEVLLDEFTARLRRGEQPSVEEYAAQHPELGDEIRELFPAATEMERLKVRKEGSSGKKRVGAPLELERLGDFRILGEVGRGGMGIVYEAVQESLGRRVALKVLPRHWLLDSKRLQRFEREARTAARLHHTNIVPVFGVGQHEGFHFYVMQFIHGVGLDSVLRELRELLPITPASPPGADDTADSGSRAAAAAIARALVGAEGETPPATAEDLAPPTERSSTPAASGSAPGRPSPTAETATCHHEIREEPSPDAGRSAEAGTTAALAFPWTDLGYWRNVAKIGLQAASALEYAHAQGTLHRDIKPANLLLDADGVVWIADFGLAKPAECDAVSQSGDVVGTLSYMAPEQFSGKAEVRSDIYSLGLTLYELLTLRPAYQDSDRRRLIDRVHRGEPIRPRKLQPRVPRDLETMVLKCVAREPSHRYESATELAADLRRFLDDRPIRARRTSSVERLWRWSRRNRAVASLSGTALLLLVLVAVVATVGYVHTARERRKVEATSELALAALDRIFEQFSPNRIVSASSVTVADDAGESFEIPVQPVLSKEAATLLEQLLKFYVVLAQEEGGNTKLREKVAEAHRRVGDIRQRLGHFDEAGAAYAKALSLYERLAAEAKGDRTLRVEIARIYNEIGNVKGATQEPPWPWHEKALRVLTETPNHSSQPYRYELARTYYSLAKGPGGPAFRPLGPPPRGARRSSAGPGRLARSVSEGGDRRFEREGPPPAKGDSPRAEPDPSRVGRRGKPPDRRLSRFREHERKREESLRNATELLEKLVEEAPRVPDYRHLLARCYGERSRGPFSEEGADSATFEDANRAVRLLQNLVEEFPNVPDFRYHLSETYAELDARARRVPGELREKFLETAEDRLRKALEISEDLVAEHPNIPDYAASRVRTLLKLAEVLRQRENRDGAEAKLREALALQEDLVRRHPKATSFRVWSTFVRGLLATHLLENGECDEARLLLENSIATLSTLAPSDRHPRYLEELLARSYFALAGVLSELGRDEEAQEALRQATEHDHRVRSDGPRPRFGGPGPGVSGER